MDDFEMQVRFKILMMVERKKVKKKIYKPKKLKKKGMLTWKLSRKRRQRCIWLGHSGLNGLKLRQVVRPTPWAGGARLGGRGVVIIVDGWSWWWSWCVVGCCKKGNNNMQGIHFYGFFYYVIATMYNTEHR